MGRGYLWRTSRDPGEERAEQEARPRNERSGDPLLERDQVEHVVLGGERDEQERNDEYDDELLGDAHEERLENGKAVRERQTDHARHDRGEQVEHELRNGYGDLGLGREAPTQRRHPQRHHNFIQVNTYNTSQPHHFCFKQPPINQFRNRFFFQGCVETLFYLVQRYKNFLRFSKVSY